VVVFLAFRYVALASALALRVVALALALEVVALALALGLVALLTSLDSGLICKTNWFPSVL